MESVKFVNQTQTNKVNELYRKARASGYAPGNYCKVQILGDERVGKTSLWKKLMGRKFDPKEPSTFGIDTQMCRVQDVDKSWHEKEYEKGSEIADCIVWKFKSQHRNDNQKRGTRIEEEAIKTDYVLHLLFGFGFLVLLLGVPQFIGYIGWSHCMKLAVALACGALIWTRNVQMYLTIKNVAEAIFTVNLVGGILFGQHPLVPNFAFGFVSFALTMQKGLVSVCQIRMGQSIVLGTALVCYTSGNSENWLLQVDLEHCVCFVLGALLGTWFFTYLSTSFAQVDTSVFTRRSLAWIEISMIALLVIFSILISLLVCNDKAIVFIVACCSAFGDEVGITLGHRLTISKLFTSTIMQNRVFWSVPAIIYGWILVKLCYDSVPLESKLIVINVAFGLLPLVLAEWYRNQLNDYTPAALDVARRTEESKAMETMPLNLSLWDFAGQDLYYNTHHTFMSAHAVYIIVFDLTKFKSDQDKQTERIRFWMDSVRQHSSSSILLVGTHRDCVDGQILHEAHRCLSSFQWTSNLVFNKQSCFFAVDNTSSLDVANDDVGILRERIHIEASKVKHLTEEYPIKWREFDEFVKDSRNMSTTTAAAHLPYIAISELREIVNRYGIEETTELLQMLAFFHDNGDVIYDSVDSVLRQFVILNPQVIIDIMQALVVVPELPNTKFRFAWKHFDRTGFLDPTLLEHIILSRLPASNGIKDEHLEVIIGMLQAKDLICKTDLGGNQSDNRNMYVVPSKLPEGPDLLQVGVTWNRRYYINFGTLLPDAVFFRLICRCMSYSDTVSCGPDRCMIFKEGGLFTLGQNFLFMLRKQYPCEKQCVIEVTVKAVHTAGGCCFEVLKYVCRILETLRCRDFRNLRFQAGPLCCYDAPHQECDGLEMLHILDLIPLMESEEPIATVFRQCNGRPLHIDLAKEVGTFLV